MPEILEEPKGAEEIGAVVAEEITGAEEVKTVDGKTTTLGAVMLALGIGLSANGVVQSLPDAMTADYKVIEIANEIRAEQAVIVLDTAGVAVDTIIDPERVENVYAQGTNNIKFSAHPGDEAVVLVKINGKIAREMKIDLAQKPADGDKWGISLTANPIPLLEGADW